MVFQCDKSGKVTSWTHLEVMYYDTEKQAIEDHDRMIKKWGNIL